MSSFESKLLVVTGSLGCGAGIGVGVAVGLALQSSFNTAVTPAIIGTISGLVAMPIAAAALYCLTMCTIVVCGVVGVIAFAGPVLDRIERGAGPSSSSRRSEVSPPDTTATISASSRPYLLSRSGDIEAGQSTQHFETTPLTTGLIGGRIRHGM